MNFDYIKDKGRTKFYPPLLAKRIKLHSQETFNQNAKQDYFGEAPNIFVGRFGYPHINVGILNTEQYTANDDIPLWVKENYSMPKIIDLRTNLLNSTFKASIKSFDDKLIQMSQEISMSTKPVDIEINLEKKPQFTLSLNQGTTPHGPNVDLKQAKLTENPHIPTVVDKVVSDTDFKAADGLRSLYDKGYDRYYLTKLISVGNLGVKPQRKLVPTRWSITAVDDTLSKKLITEIKDYPVINEPLAFFGGYMGNYFLVLMFTDVWQYELFEMITVEQTAFSTDYEPYTGRKTYAENTVGGYYGNRLRVLEKLKLIKRQASVLCLRFINPYEYIAPLGVFVTTEACANAVSQKPLEFSSKELMLTFAEKFALRKFNFNISGILKKSKLVDSLMRQRKLVDF